jgi:uncharacterized protein
MRTIAFLLALAAIAYACFLAFMYATQRSQIYFPTGESAHPVAQVLLLESGGERLKIWNVPQPEGKALIYFGGNAEDVAGSIDALSSALPEYSLYLVNYRGYGGSTGRPTEKGLFVDGLAVFDHVRSRHSSVVVMGRSLGSGVAVHVASRRPVDSLVLVTPFDSLVNVARGHLPHLPVGLLMRDRYDSVSQARNVTSPVLAVMAQADEIIPEVRSSALVAAFPADQVSVEVIPGVGHNTLDQSPAYLGAVRAFLSRSP